MKELAIAIIGFPNCDSCIPFARQRLRAPAILLPAVEVALRNFFASCQEDASKCSCIKSAVDFILIEALCLEGSFGPSCI